MDSAEKYEMIGLHIYRYERVKVHLISLLTAINPKAQKGALEAELDVLIPRITAELSDRGPEIQRQFSGIAAEIYELRNERDRNIGPAHIPHAQKTTDFVAKCTDVLAKLATLKTILRQHQ
ncbi:hypothetical protein NHH88_14230 [Oxalobacteraceae bacterium OTU3CAMAD1]|nr:hypothetical protein NHH88_14230 [Oxalobacteraceae bacterium OTU3CAMAD1]